VIENKEIIAGLNNRQIEAVTLDINCGPVMVLAGAGTGKTSVLTKRIAYLCKNGVPPENILAVTFTNKAANELKERLHAMNVSNAPAVGTFHSIGLRIIKLCPAAAGVRNGFTVMDQDETLSLWKRCFVVPEKTPILPGQGVIHKSDPDYKRLLEGMFKLKEEGTRTALPASDNAFNNEINRMLTVYEAARKEQNRVDFSDLISASLEAILHHNAGQEWAKNYTHVLVDEFQDTSILQFQWATAILAGEKTKQNLFCVGDDNQSIYAFRGANIKNIDKFVKSYHAKEILLEQNYRCGSAILDAANHLIAINENGDKKKLWTENPTGTIKLKSHYNDVAEADAIAMEMLQYKEPLSTCAVLVRTRATMVPVARALRSNGIEHHVVGSHDFFDAKEVRDAMALVRFAINNEDTISFERSAGLFPGIGRKTILDLIDRAAANNIPLLDACRSEKKFQPILEAFNGINGESECFDSVFSLALSSGLRRYCEKAEEAIRIANLNDFCDLAGQFETLTEFMEEMTLFADKETRHNGVTVSTIHAAKGLEWNRVYLPVLTEKHLPMTEVNFSTGRLDPEDFLEREEERRLMYVAITRAKKELFISFPERRMVHGKIDSCVPSCFLREAKIKMTQSKEAEEDFY
jgi:DNA helicase-2/ATP-dependent DNA helicase PcrA